MIPQQFNVVGNLDSFVIYVYIRTLADGVQVAVDLWSVPETYLGSLKGSCPYTISQHVVLPSPDYLSLHSNLSLICITGGRLRTSSGLYC